MMHRYHNMRGRVEGKGILLVMIMIPAFIGYSHLWSEIPTWSRIVSIVSISILIIAVLAMDEAGFNTNSIIKATFLPIHLAVKDGNGPLLEQLIAEGTDVNAKGFYERTALYLAAKEGRTKVIQLLIAKGADVNAKDEFGKTPLSVANMQSHKEVADLLRKHGAVD